MSIFQFTPLREGRQPITSHAREVLRFQFTPLREGRRGALCQRAQDEHFNSRPSARGDQRARKVVSYGRSISIHAPPRGATQIFAIPFADNAISIHAPPRGATGYSTAANTAGLFQFTPLREGRRRRRSALTSRKNFNSRPSARGDGNGECPEADECISIHAPPRGATRHHQPTSTISYFNSRPSARGDPQALIFKRLRAYFNSRPSARGDGFTFNGRHCRRISIHAPPRGATGYHEIGGEGITFQFTPLREGRRSQQTRWHPACQFQFTPLREGRPP